jgi:cell division protein FtsB
MTSKQTTWVMFGISLVISMVFLSVLVRTNYDLDDMRRTIVTQNKQIDLLTKLNSELVQKVKDLDKSQSLVTKDLDKIKTVQENQINDLYRIRNRKR